MDSNMNLELNWQSANVHIKINIITIEMALTFSK